MEKVIDLQRIERGANRLDDLRSRIMRLCRLFYEDALSSGIVAGTMSSLAQSSGDDDIEFTIVRMDGGRATIKANGPDFEVCAVEILDRYSMVFTAYEDDDKIEQVGDCLDIVEEFVRGGYSEEVLTGPAGQIIPVRLISTDEDELSTARFHCRLVARLRRVFCIPLGRRKSGLLVCNWVLTIPDDRLLRAQVRLTERLFGGAGYNDPTEDHRNRRRRRRGVACRVTAARRHRGPDPLTGQLAEAVAGLRKPRARHDPGRVLVDMAVAVADGATTISDVAVLADQAALFGAVASDSTCWRLLDQLDTVALGTVARARAAARDVLILDPDTTSGGSDRQNQDAGGITMPSSGNATSQRDGCDYKIDSRSSNDRG